MYEKIIKKLPNSKYKIILQEGSFGIPTVYWKYVVWYNCRDTFQSINNKELRKGLFFIVNKFSESNCNKTVLLMKKIEDVLCVKVRSKFYMTNEKGIIYIKQSSFWTKNLIRKSFLTLALRCGLYYDKSKTIEQIIKCHNYGKNTVKAIKWFLKGNTNLDVRYIFDISDDEGWSCLFRGMKMSDIKDILK